MSDLKMFLKAGVAITAIICLASIVVVGPMIFNFSMPMGLQFGGVLMYLVVSVTVAFKLFRAAKEI